MSKNVKYKLTIITLFFAAALFYSVHAKTKSIRLKTAPPIYKNNRTALVIGNAAYKSDPLLNPVNDARAMEKALDGMGFKVTLLENASQREMEENIDIFGEKLSEDGGIGLFYFSGHGMQVNGENYLIPVRENITHENKVKYASVNARYVIDTMENAQLASMNIIILDACRNNPFIQRRSRSASQGLARYQNTPEGTIIAYATAPGSTADDGEEEGLGLYTGELIRHMKTPGLRIIDVFRNVRASVLRKSRGNQIPREFSNLMPGAFYLVPTRQNTNQILSNPDYDTDGKSKIMVIFKKKPDSNLENMLKRPRSYLFSGLESLVENLESIDFMGQSEIDSNKDFLINLKRAMILKDSNASLVMKTEWDVRKDPGKILWEAIAKLEISIDSYSFKRGRLIKKGSYSIKSQNLPISKWDDSDSFKQKYLERVAKKVVKKWNDEGITAFVKSIK